MLFLHALGVVLHGIKLALQVVAYGRFWRDYSFVATTSFADNRNTTNATNSTTVVLSDCNCCSPDERSVTYDACRAKCDEEFQREDLDAGATEYMWALVVIVLTYHALESLAVMVRVRDFVKNEKSDHGKGEKKMDEAAQQEKKFLEEHLLCCGCIPNCCNMCCLMYLHVAMCTFKGLCFPVHFLLKKLGLTKIVSLLISIAVSMIVNTPRDKLSYAQQCSYRTSGVLVLVFLGLVLLSLAAAKCYLSLCRSVTCYAARNQLLVASLLVMLTTFIISAKFVKWEFPRELTWRGVSFYFQLTLPVVLFMVDVSLVAGTAADQRVSKGRGLSQSAAAGEMGAEMALHAVDHANANRHANATWGSEGAPV